VAFDSAQKSDALTGKVNPLLAGTPVTVERQTRAGWVFAAGTTLQPDGSFRAAFDVEEGVYRARVVPPGSTGMVTGLSPVLHVVKG
jgi:hypothetical protein